MPVNNFSVGKDVSLTIVTASGPLTFDLITDFTSKFDETKTRIKGLDGKTRWVRFPDGWSGSFKIDRRNSTVDDYFSQIEANYYQGLNEHPASITEIIQEPNGSVTQYRYIGVLLTLDDAGNWAGDSTVKQSISFVSERRLKIQ